MHILIGMSQHTQKKKSHDIMNENKSFDKNIFFKNIIFCCSLLAVHKSCLMEKSGFKLRIHPLENQKASRILVFIEIEF